MGYVCGRTQPGDKIVLFKDGLPKFDVDISVFDQMFNAGIKATAS